MDGWEERDLGHDGDVVSSVSLLEHLRRMNK